MLINFFIKHFKALVYTNLVIGIITAFIATLNCLIDTNTASIISMVICIIFLFIVSYFSFKAIKTYDGLKNKELLTK